jgi:hypothetical protein
MLLWNSVTPGPYGDMAEKGHLTTDVQQNTAITLGESHQNMCFGVIRHCRTDQGSPHSGNGQKCDDHTGLGHR